MIDQLEVQSRSRENVKHTLYIHNGLAVGCTCESRKFHMWTECRHMFAYNWKDDPFMGVVESEIEPVNVEPVIELPTRFNEELFRKETYCHNHWWYGDTCLYGAHAL